MVRGVKVRPSPAWIVERLATVGIAAINNVVDISNYVLMECGQPLHTFDYAKLRGPEIVVRRPRPGETIEAIDHKTYALEPGMCVIADARDAVAIGGVMGGAATEVSAATTAVLVEAAEFDPISIRTHRPAAEPAQRFVLSLRAAGGSGRGRLGQPPLLRVDPRPGRRASWPPAWSTSAAGPPPRRPIVLRFAQLKRILGIDVPPERVRQILAALGNVEATPPAGSRPPGQSSITVIPPSWRRDLSREIDLVEEVARIHGYEKIPEDVGVPMAPSARSREDRVLEKVRQVLIGGGRRRGDDAERRRRADGRRVQPLDRRRAAAEPDAGAPRGRPAADSAWSPACWPRGATNEALANADIELFEIAKVYLPAGRQLAARGADAGHHQRPRLRRGQGARRGGRRRRCNPALELAGRGGGLAAAWTRRPPAGCGWAAKCWATSARLRPEGLKQFDLRGPTTVAEVKLAPLVAAADLVPRYVPLPPYPAVTPRPEPGGRRGGPLGRRGGHGAAARRAGPGKPRISRHLSRPAAARARQEKPAVHHRLALEGRHADQPPGRRRPRPRSWPPASTRTGRSCGRKTRYIYRVPRLCQPCRDNVGPERRVGRAASPTKIREEIVVGLAASTHPDMVDTVNQEEIWLPRLASGCLGILSPGGATISSTEMKRAVAQNRFLTTIADSNPGGIVSTGDPYNYGAEGSSCLFRCPSAGLLRGKQTLGG